MQKNKRHITLKITISTVFTLCVVLFVVSSCGKQKKNCVLTCEYASCDGAKISSSENIDWENYNGVHTYLEAYGSPRCCCQEWMINDHGKQIKVAGWLLRGNDNFYDTLYHSARFRLIDNSDESNIFAVRPTFDYVRFYAECAIVHEALRAKVVTADITSKWYIRGELCMYSAWLTMVNNVNCMPHCILIPWVLITNANDVYFE